MKIRDKRYNTEKPIHTNQEPAFQKEEMVNLASALIVSTIDSINGLKKNDEYIEHLAAIVECCNDAIISKSLSGIIKTWNKGSENMFGYTSKEAVGKHISLIIPPEYIAEERKIIERIRNGESINHYETVRLKKNGEKFYVSLTVSPLKDAVGKIIGVSKIARDITSGKKSEAELIFANKKLVFQNTEKEKRAEELVIANKELIFQNEEKEKRAAELIVADKELAFQNREKEKRAEELIIANKELVFQNAEKGKRAAELIVANTELAFQNTEKENRASELIIANRELVFQNKEKEKITEKLLVANEELILSEKQFKEVNKELESFSYSISHDLRAPLRAISGYSKKLERNFETQLDPEARRLMNNIMENAKKMGQLIDELLNFSRLGRQQLVKVNVQMQNMVTTICTELKNEQADRNIEFHINKLLPAQADNFTLKQVWINLISNAIKYSKLKDTSIIEIGSQIKNGEVIYYIKDNGAGFNMEYYDKLFGVFQRLHSDEEFEGTGVGLALVQRIIFKHGGSIWAEAQVDQGATFYFTLKMNSNDV